jgi:uncharacterized protein (TIGR04141 family)
MTTVSCYVASDAQDFDDLIDAEVLADRRLQRLGPKVFGDCMAVLYFVRPVARTPGWVAALQDGFDDFPELRAESAGAALVFKVPYEASGSLFLAFTFGTGRFLLDPDAWIRGFGARAALNVIFEGDDGSLPASRLQSINATRFEAARLQISHQTNRLSPFEAFGIDIVRDILREVVGTPVDKARWGSRIGGGDPLKLSSLPAFDDLPGFSKQILDIGRRSDYLRRFDWIDHIREVRDPAIKARLTERVISDLAGGKLDSYELVVPTMVEWDRIDRFQFDIDRALRNQEPQRRIDPTLRQFLKTLREGTDVNRGLLGRKRMYAVDGNGEPQYQWSIWSCLSAELEEGNKSYALDNSVFYELDPDYDMLIRGFVDAIDEWTVGLPSGVVGLREDAYNARAAKDSDALLLMDRRLVTLVSRTSPIEVCDLYSTDGALVHVKKQQGASSMSHLFSQGVVSADLLVTSRDFREKSLEHVRRVASKKARGKRAAYVLSKFQLFEAGGMKPWEHRIVFAILDRRWNGKLLSNGLSFFSRVNLRRTVEDVRRLGYEVAVRRVPMVLP